MVAWLSLLSLRLCADMTCPDTSSAAGGRTRLAGLPAQVVVVGHRDLSLGLEMFGAIRFLSPARSSSRVECESL